MSARFLRHEGYLGAVGAYLKVHPMPAPPASGSESAQGKVGMFHKDHVACTASVHLVSYLD